MSLSAPAAPIPTRDVDTLKRDLDVHGYCFIKDFIDADQVAALKRRLADQGAAERERGIAQLGMRGEHWLGAPRQDADGWGTHVVRNIINKGDEFLPLLVDPLLLSLVQSSLKDLPFYLSSYHGLILKRGSGLQFIHTDQAHLPEVTSFPYVMNTIVMLTDFTEENGATRIAPGSHKWKRIPQVANGGERVDTIAAVAPAGTAMLFEGRLWHGGGDNVTDAKRYALTIYYALAFLRQQECMPASTHPEVYARLSDQLKELLGFKMQMSVGRIEPSVPDGISSMEAKWAYTGRLVPSRHVPL